jgi:hypothetical protein
MNNLLSFLPPIRGAKKEKEANTFQEDSIEKMLTRSLDESKQAAKTEEEIQKEMKDYLANEEKEVLQKNKELRRQQYIEMLKNVKNLGKNIQDAIANFGTSLVDYGPPYYDDPDSSAQLVYVCAKYPVNLSEIHLILNERVDPNCPDTSDLYFYPIHWAARNMSLLACRMLLRAGAKINVTNEFGHSALHLATVIYQTRDRRSAQLKVCRFLVEQGADVNIIDKGGYTAIDYAAKNNDMKLMKLYLEAGAKVRRDNHTFVAPRESLLETIQAANNKKAYGLVIARHAEEMKAHEEEVERIATTKRIQDALAASQKAEKQYQKKRTAAKTAAIRKKEEAKLQKFLEQNNERLERKQRAEALKDEQFIPQYGEWYRNDGDATWEFRDDIPTGSVLHNGYMKAKQTLRALRAEKRIDKYNERWHALTGKHLEIPWDKIQLEDPFGDDEREAEEKRRKEEEEEAEREARRKEEEDHQRVADEAMLGGDDVDDILDALKAL